MSFVLAVACRTVRIGNELGRSIVVFSTFKGTVGLPQVLQTGSRADSRPSRRTCALFRTVVHDCDAGTNCIYKCFGVGFFVSMMIDDKKIDSADQILGTDKLQLFFLCEVAKVED